MKKYPEEIAEYIASHVTGRTAQQLATELNEKFSEKYGMSFDKEKIRQYKRNHKLKSGTIRGTPKGFSLVYPAGMEEFVRSIANGKTTKELAEVVNEKYGAGTITAKKMRAYKRNHNIVSGIDCKFQPGHTPANKGKPMSPEQYERCKETMFKKGQVPPNRLNVGEYTHTTDGYLIRKIREQGTQRERFEFVHRAVWEEHNGPIPDGKMVSFLDGDKDNCSIENLFLTDNATNLEMNRQKLRFKNPELTAVGEKVARLNIAIRSKAKLDELLNGEE